MSAEAELTGFLLQMLKEEVMGYINTKSRAKLELQMLNDELLLLEAFIKDSANRSAKKEVFREKERQIRELVYDVEDAIETCLAKKAAAKAQSFFPRQFRKLSISMAKQVKSLREDRVKPILQEITNEFGKMEVDDGSTVENSQMDVKKVQAVTASSVSVFEEDQSVRQSSSQSESYKQDKVVDFVEQETIINKLLQQREELDVISITGMPGIGKTTLARRVLHHPDVVERFHLRIWIQVSQTFNSREAFLDILKKLNHQAKSNSSEEELIPTVRGCLENKKFLLVMDDVWKVDDWNVIANVLSSENREGKVLVTTREGVVARAAASFGRTPHQMNRLGDEKSWELLKLNVFGRIKKCPRDLEAIGVAIARKCGGSPLIIGVIGGILKDHVMQKNSTPAIKSEWTNLYANVGNNLITGKDKSISDAVELSYNRLSDKLRVCFLYTGLFPDNHEIPASTLTQLWIAEGFIRPEDGNSLEGTAYKLLNDLISMNLLMVERKNLDQVKSCRVHDTIREFCKAKAAEENLFTVVKEVTEPSFLEVENLRRVCLHSDTPESIFAARRVRSFICFFQLDQKQITTIPDAFNLLRVLSCTPIKLREFPKVTKLILLKHITLFIVHLDTLPNEIYRLINLQTLIIETNSHSIQVNPNIWKMLQLRRVKTEAAIFLVEDKKSRIKAHENLQTLSKLSPESCTTALSDRACNLKTLGIRGKLDTLFDKLSLKKFLHLEKLMLAHDLTKSPLNPQQGCFPPMLKRLTLSNTHLKWDSHMPVLAAIHTLEVLKLKNNAFDDLYWNAMDVAFRNLQFLLVEETEIISWEASPTQFPSLRWLALKKCEKLQNIPSELKHAENLEKLELEAFSASVAESAKAIKSFKDEEINQFGVSFELIVHQIHK